MREDSLAKLASAVGPVSSLLRWPGSVKTRFAFHIELGYTIVDLDIRYFAIQGYTVYVCGHRADLRVNCPGIGPKQARERGKPSHVECI